MSIMIIISSEVNDCELYFKRTVFLSCTAVYYAVQGGSNFPKCDHSNYTCSYCVAFSCDTLYAVQGRFNFPVGKSYVFW